MKGRTKLVRSLGINNKKDFDEATKKVTMSGDMEEEIKGAVLSGFKYGHTGKFSKQHVGGKIRQIKKKINMGDS